VSLQEEAHIVVSLMLQTVKLFKAETVR